MEPDWASKVLCSRIREDSSPYSLDVADWDDLPSCRGTVCQLSCSVLCDELVNRVHGLGEFG
jgi:hypothetical protein